MTKEKNILKTILVVSGDEQTSQQIAECLKSHACLIQQATHGQQALTIIRESSVKTPIDIVISESKMAPMNGLGLISQLRSHGSDIPVILLSDGSIAVEILHQASPYFLARDQGKLDITALAKLVFAALYPQSA